MATADGVSWKIFYSDWQEGQVTHHLMHLIAWVNEDGYEFTEAQKEQLKKLVKLVKGENRDGS